MLFRRPREHIVQQRLQLAVIAGGQARERDLIVSGILAQLPPGLGEHVRIALPHRTIQETGLTETAPAHTSAQDFDLCTVMDGTDHRNDKMRRERLRIHIADDRLGHDCRSTVPGLYALNPPVRQIGNIIQRGDVNAFDLRAAPQDLLLRKPFLSPLNHCVAHRGELDLAFSEHHKIEEISQRLAVAYTRAARDNNGHIFPSLRRIERDMRQIKHRQNIGIGELILKRESDHVESAQFILALQSIERNAALFHFLFHVHPGHERSFTPDILSGIEDLIEDLHAQKGHSDLIGVRKAECETKIYFVFVLIDAARFSAGITPGLLNGGKCRTQFLCHVNILPSVASTVCGRTKNSLPQIRTREKPLRKKICKSQHKGRRRSRRQNAVNPSRQHKSQNQYPNRTPEPAQCPIQAHRYERA